MTSLGNATTVATVPRLTAAIARGVLVAAAAATVGWAIVDGRFRGADGSYTGLLVLPLTSALAALVVAAGLGRRWQTSAFWLALALVSQGALLQLVNAGWQLRYQHYKPVEEIASSVSPLVWGILVVQALAVLAGLSRWWRPVVTWCRDKLGVPRTLLLAAAFLLFTTTLSENPGSYVRELVFASAVQLLQLANVVLIGVSIPAASVPGLQRRIDRLLGPRDESAAAPGGVDRVALATAVWVAVVAALLNVLAYDRHPHVPDEVVYLTHSAFFASGVLSAPAPPVPEAFDVYLMQVDGDRWYPVPPPGWPAILAIGSYFGAAWLVNPVLAGLNVLLAFALVRELYPLRTARVAVLLLGLSPWYLFLGMSFMTHMFALSCALVAALGVARARRAGGWRWALAGGLALGAIALIRPLEVIATGALLALWAIGLGGTRLTLSAMAALAAGAAITGGSGLLYNAALTGDPLTFPINVYIDERFAPNANAYGFGPDRGMGWALDPNPGHGPVDAVINTNLNVTALNAELFGWSVGSWLPILAFVAIGRRRAGDGLMVAAIAVVYVLHFFYYFSGGPDFGARYWFLMAVPLVVLAARGLEALGQHTDTSDDRGSARVMTVAAMLAVMAMVSFVPWRALDKYQQFRGMRGDIRRLATDYHFGTSLVLVRGNQHPDFDSAVVYNPVDLRGDAPIFAWDRDPQTRVKLLTAYGDRPVWIVDSPSVTGGTYEVAGGPFAAEALLEQVER